MFTEVLFIIAKNGKSTQIFMNWWMDKQNVIYWCNEILFSQRKEQSTDTCCNMDKLWKHYAKWKNLVTRGHMIPFIWNVQNRQIYRDGKLISGCQVLVGLGGNEKWLL